MGAANKDGQFEVKPLPIVGSYARQRFKQFSPEDAANWYVVTGKDTKRDTAMYPILGRAHINTTGSNQLIFGSEPRQEFKTIKYAYIVVGNSIFRIDENYNQVNITSTVSLATFSGPIYFAFLVVAKIVFACFVDEEHIYIYREDTQTFDIVTDPRAPGNVVDTKPGYIAAFGNRIVVSVLDSSQFFLSAINLGGSSYTAGSCFTTNSASIFAQESGVIRQMGVLNSQLYLFTDYTTGIWSNTPAKFDANPPIIFPWKKNSSTDWNYGIANPTSLDISFGRLVFLARNIDGLLQFMVSYGNDQPQPLSSKSIDTLLQKYTNEFGADNPFLSSNSNGFLYQYENTVFYRFSGGEYNDDGLLDQTLQANSIEYNFEIQDWHRCIELNGERNRVQYHVYFNFKHLVSLVGDSTVYDMSGQYYYNERRNTDQDDPQAPDAYIADPFRYERITPSINEQDYSEFETEYVEIDFVFGDSDINFSTAPFTNTQFVIKEDSLPGSPVFMVDQETDIENQPIFIIADNSNFPTISDKTYNNFYKPTVELYFSDDSGISFNTADLREFSQMGQYQWRMRWYQLGPSRNRVYKLICVSPVPIVVLGGVMNVRRISGGAN